MTTITELVPFTPRPSQVYPQYTTIDERQAQQAQKYQQSKYNAWASETSQEKFISNNTTGESITKSCSKHMTAKFVMCLLIGLIICGIPLAVMSALYVQKKSSPSSDSGSSGSSGSSSSNLPSQCTSYTANADSTRLTSYAGCVSCLYDSSPYFSTGWYRFVDTAGTRLARMPSNTGTCGASYPAWYNGTLPSTSGSTVSSTACVNVNGNLCSPSYILPISITNCDSYYVYYLQPTPITSIRYCTTF